MIGVAIKPISKGMFFDAPAVMKAINDADRRVLSKFGRYVQVRAKTSIRPAAVANRKAVNAGKKIGKKVRVEYIPSKPGEPPRSRRGELKKFILFGYEAETRNVVIGPTLVAGRASETPGRLERGGEVRMKKSGRIIRVKKRPYMLPALEKELTRMPALYADSLIGR